MDVQRIEVLDALNPEDSHGSQFHQSRNRTARDQNESKIPVPRARRATGEGMQRPRMGHSKGSGSTSSVSPRPVSKGRTGRGPQPTTIPSAYSFDDPTIDPFMPSTPPTFTASMEPTFFKSAGAPSTVTTNENNRKSNDSMGNTPKQTRGFDPKPADKRAVTKPQTQNSRSPSSPVAKPFNTSTASYRGTRSRDVSVSSSPGPNHDDMILPAVARRLKEQGELYDHDVIAYSDDYHAPLYKLPAGSPGTKGNPFASYDRAKAASTSDLHQRSPSGSWNSHNPEPEPPMPMVTPTSLFNNQSSVADTNGSDKNTNSVFSTAASPPSQGTNARNSSDLPATVPSSPPPSQRGVRPERPQRARRNTQPENMSPRSTEEYDRNGSRRPTRAEAEAYSQMSNQGQQQQQQQQQQHQQSYQQESSLQNSRQSSRQNNGYDRQQHLQNNNQYQDQYTGRAQGSNYGAQEADRHDTRQQQQGQNQHFQQQLPQPSGYDQRYNYSDPRDANFSSRDNIYPAQHQYQQRQYQQQQQQQQRPDAMTTIEMSEVSSPVKDEQKVERMDAAQVPKKKGTVCCVVM